MNDLIKLKLVTEDEAECLHRLQVEAFMPLYEKYQDDDTSPAKESLKRVTEKIIEENSDFYFIVFHGEKVGGVRVRWHQGKKVNENVNWISPIFIITEFQNKGIASTVIEQLFGIYPNTIEWRLDTIKQETGNCHLYEKYGFVRVGEDIVVNEKMTLVGYVKNCINVRRFEEEDADEVSKLTNTPAQIAADISKWLMDEINGSGLTGFNPYEKNGKIYFNQRWLMMIGKKL